MVILYIPTPDIPAAMTHMTTDWRIATTPTFDPATIVAESLDDPVNLTSIILEIDLDSATTYYAQARVVADSAVFEPSDVGIVRVEDFIRTVFDYPIPSAVMTPEISIDFPVTDIPNTMFRITTTPMSATSNADHLATTYIIEDLDGTPIYADIDNRDDLTTKLIDDIILTDGRPYIIKVSYRSTSGDISNFASQIVYVNNIPEIVIKSDIEQVDPDSNLVVIIAPITGFIGMDITYHEVGFSDANLLYQGSSVSLVGVIPVGTMQGRKTNKYMLGINVHKDDGSSTGIKYFQVTSG